MIEELGHGEADQQRVLDGPNVRSVSKKAKLQRQRLGVLGDVCVHAVGVGLKLRALRRVHGGDGLFRDLPQAEDALLAVGSDKVRAEDHGQIAGSEAARHVHLPQPLLRGDIALSEEEIAKVRRGDGRDPERIARDRYRLGESGHSNGAVFLRQSGAHSAVKPDIEGEEDDQQQQQEER